MAKIAASPRHNALLFTQTHAHFAKYGELTSGRRHREAASRDLKVTIINKTTSRDPTIMVLFRQLVLACLKFNIFFSAQHVPGVHNTSADALSRLQVSKFKELAPAGVQALPTVIHSHLMPRNWSI